MKSAFSLLAKPLNRNRGVIDLVREWPQRLDHVQPMLPYLSAAFVLKYIQQKLPKGSDYKTYRQGLEVVRVRGLPEGQYAYTVQVDMKNRLVRKVRPQQVLLYVHAKEREARTDPATSILAKYNPWTYDSLPFTPDPKFGWVRTKKVRLKEVSKTTELRNRDRSQWSKELARVGRRMTPKSNKIKIPKKVSTLPNIALEALKLEFGLGGTKPRPMWRIGVRTLIKSELRRFAKNPKYFVFPFTKPSYNLWKRWPLRTKHSIPATQALKYIPFQRKLGIRP
jgi:hypothetical protein